MEDLTSVEFRGRFPSSFWLQFLEYIISNDAEEDQFWDYKADLGIYKPKNKKGRLKETQELLKDITAFCNAESGLLIYGITDKKPRKIIGVENPEQLIQKVLDLIKRRCEKIVKVFNQVVPIQANSITKFCILFIIPKTPDPIAIADYRTGNPTYYIREGPVSSPIQDHKGIAELFKTKSGLSKAEYPVLGIIQKLISYPAFQIPKYLVEQYSNTN
ncbi:MAG: helix-turn-helix domain-containing protein, partial [Candidatus Thorarchaeota archaeon]